MQHEYYHYLVRLVEAGSLSEAANSLYMSPQGLSRAMKQMSNELGVNIFYRNKDGLQLTSAGREVYKAAKEIQTIDNKLENRLFPDLSDPETHGLIIYAAPHIHIAYLSKCLKKIYRQNTNGSIQLTDMSLWNIPKVKDPSSNTIRLFSVLEPMYESFLDELDERYCVHEFGRAQLLCSVSAKSKMADEPSVTLDWMSKHKLALFSTEYDIVDVVFGKEEKCDISVMATNYLVKCQMIAHDQSLVGFSDSLVEQNTKIPLIKNIPIVPKVHTIYGYIVPKNMELSMEVQNAIRIINEEFQQINI